MPSVLARLVQPDDVELRAARALIPIVQQGLDLHYCNLSIGNLVRTSNNALNCRGSGPRAKRVPVLDTRLCAGC